MPRGSFSRSFFFPPFVVVVEVDEVSAEEVEGVVAEGEGEGAAAG